MSVLPRASPDACQQVPKSTGSSASSPFPGHSWLHREAQHRCQKQLRVGWGEVRSPTSGLAVWGPEAQLPGSGT